jgi:hypothetical protein
VYDEVATWVTTRHHHPLFYRGHANAEWHLLPSIGRIEWMAGIQGAFVEHNAYYEFITRAGSLLPEGVSSWNVAFAMQHHGLPTRLLDWSDTFAVAVHFALGLPRNDSSAIDSAIWILDPTVLNRQTIKMSGIFHPTELEADYSELFVSRTKTLPGGLAAILPLRHHPRVFSQRGAFTVHADLAKPLETLYPSAVKKVLLPASARAGARLFLELAGISEFSLFPDLDGLARELSSREFRPR